MTLRTIIQPFASLYHAIVDSRFTERLRHLREEFYSAWVSCEFASCGRTSRFGGFSRLKGGKYIQLGNGLYVGCDIVWELFDRYRDQTFTPSLSIGDNSSFGDGGHISCINRIEIGQGVRIGRKVFITDNGHGATERQQLDTPANLRPLVSKGPVVIEDNAWIGEMVCIMPGVTIGRGAIVGANAVVTHDIPPYCMAAGNPAHVIRNLE